MMPLADQSTGSGRDGDACGGDGDDAGDGKAAVLAVVAAAESGDCDRQLSLRNLADLDLSSTMEPCL